MPDEIGYLLWRALRVITLWASARDTSELFTPEAPGTWSQAIAELDDPALRHALADVVGLVRDPAAAEPSIVAGVCDQIATWAEAHGNIGTRAEYARAAALADPHTAARCITIGVILRDSGQTATAESWLLRAIGLSRGGRDWEAYVKAHIALGQLHLHSAPATARTYLERAMRAARRNTPHLGKEIAALLAQVPSTG